MQYTIYIYICSFVYFNKNNSNNHIVMIIMMKTTIIIICNMWCRVQLRKLPATRPQDFA